MQTIFSKASEGQEKQDLKMDEEVGRSFSLSHSEKKNVWGCCYICLFVCLFICLCSIAKGKYCAWKLSSDMQPRKTDFVEPDNGDMNGDLSTVDLSLLPLKDSRTLFYILRVDLQPKGRLLLLLTKVVSQKFFWSRRKHCQQDKHTPSINQFAKKHTW